LRGVGKTPASGKIEIDRYSAISESGTSVEFLDSLNTFKGWKVILKEKNAWVKYNAVDFAKDNSTSLVINALSQKGGALQLHLDKPDGPLLTEVKIPQKSDWTLVHTKIAKIPTGIHNIVLISSGEYPVEVDWIRF
jgi:hypothetical protein